MFSHISWKSQIIDASFEIALMLAGAFVLWFLLAWVIKPKKSFVVLDTIELEAYKKQSSFPIISKNIHTPVIWKKQSLSDQETVQDDFTLIYGLTPKVQKLLDSVGICSFEGIIDADVEGLEKILYDAWGSFKRYNPATWPDQARLAQKGHWRELEEYQAILQKKK